VSKGAPALLRLGELERSVLEYLWSAGEAGVVQVHAAIGKRRIMPNTVGSALERLHRKGLVRRQKVSHAYRYSPALGADEFAARRVVEAAGGLPALAGAGLLAAFVDLVAGVDEAALDRLEQLIAQKRDRRGPP
jgi:predicted transcriptional regulator